MSLPEDMPWLEKTQRLCRCQLCDLPYGDGLSAGKTLRLRVSRVSLTTSLLLRDKQAVRDEEYI